MLRKFQNDFRRFMIGRYGNDTLNNAIFGCLFVVLVIEFFSNATILRWIYAILLAITVLRALSKNRTRRRKENQIFLKITRPIRVRLNILVRNLSDQGHRYYLCPQCNAKVRIPSGHGKVAIICPHCRHEFTKRS